MLACPLRAHERHDEEVEQRDRQTADGGEFEQHLQDYRDDDERKRELEHEHPSFGYTVAQDGGKCKKH